MSSSDRSDGALVPVQLDVPVEGAPGAPAAAKSLRAGRRDFRLHPETRRWLFYVGVVAPVVLAVASGVQELVLAVAR